MSIRARVTWYGIGIVGLVLVITTGALGLLLVGGVPAGQDQELRDRATAAVASVQAAATLARQEPVAPVDALAGKDIVVTVLDQDGAVLATTGLVGGEEPAIPADLLARSDRDGSAVATLRVGGAGLRVHVRPWRRGTGHGYVVAAQADRRRVADQAGVVVVIVIADLLAMGAAAVAIWLAAGRALRPLRQLASTADDVARSADLARRLPPVRRPDDLGRLTVSFNAMMDRLQDAYVRLAAAFNAQQRFTADVSHELRTPLTTIRSNAGFLRAHPDADAVDRDGAVADIESESDRMSRLVDDLLALARADAGTQEPAPVDLGQLVTDVAAQARRAHPDRRIYAGTEPVTMPGDADGLRRLLWILIRNAVAHTGDGGQIWISATVQPTGLVLYVSDDGCGIPAGQHERIFDRFHRARPEAAGPGTGLGLAIARSIAGWHGGEILAADNPLGGAVFVVTLPAALSSTS